MYPDGGGLEYCWRLRLALEAEGVQLLDRIFVTGLLQGRRRPHRRRRRRAQPHRHVPRHQGARHHRVHQRDHVPLRLRARHHRHRHAARLSGRRRAAQRGIQLRAAGHAEILFRGHHVRDPGGRAFRQRQGRGVHARPTSRTGPTRPTCRASRAPWRWRRTRATIRSTSTCRRSRKACANTSSRAK